MQNISWWTQIQLQLHQYIESSLQVPKKTTSWFYKLSLVEVNKLNLPRSPCVEDPSYSFLSCVRRSVASKVRVPLVTKFSKCLLISKVGCRTKWDVWSDTSTPLCTSGDQFRWEIFLLDMKFVKKSSRAKIYAVNTWFAPFANLWQKCLMLCNGIQQRKPLACSRPNTFPNIGKVYILELCLT